MSYMLADGTIIFRWEISRGIEGDEHIATKTGRPRFNLTTRNDAARLVNYLNDRCDELVALREENARLREAAGYLLECIYDEGDDSRYPVNVLHRALESDSAESEA
jgi:hypothetical protein